MDKKKQIKGILIAVGLFVLLVYIWWQAPKHLLDGATADEIIRIEVVNQTTGNQFVIEDPENVGRIMRNLMRAEFRKDGFSLADFGDVYKLKVYDSRERMLGTILLHSRKHIKVGTFFYASENVTLCKDIIEDLENESMNEAN